jgi:hypothetical protein
LGKKLRTFVKMVFNQTISFKTLKFKKVRFLLYTTIDS